VASSSGSSTVELGNSDPAFLQARDRLVADLQERLFALQTALKVSEEHSFFSLQRHLEEALEEKNALLAALKEVERKDLEKEQISIKENCEIDLHKGRIQELEGKHAVLTQEIEEKDRQLKTFKGDLGELSAIIQRMNALNSELHDKLGSVQDQLVEAGKREYESGLKLGLVGELEAEIERLQAERSQFRTETGRKQLYLKAISVLNNTELPAEDRVQQARNTLETECGFRGNEAELEIAQLKQALRKLEITRDLQKSRLQQLETAHFSLRTEDKAAGNVALTQTCALQEAANRSRAECKDWEGRCSSLQASLWHLQAQLQTVLSSQHTLQFRFQALQTAHKSLRIAFKQQQIALFDAKFTLNSRLLTNQRQIKESWESKARIKVLNEEIWRKETEVVSKERAKIKLEAEVRTLKASFQQSKAGNRL